MGRGSVRAVGRAAVTPTAGVPGVREAGWWRDRTVAAVLGITAVALVLRLPQLDQSLFGDELFAFDEVVHRSFGGMLDAVLNGPEVTPPAYFVLAWITAQFGDPTIWIRLPSLLAGVALVPLTYALGTLTAGRRAALFAAAVMALSPLAIFYSVEARPYALLALVVTATTVCLLRALPTRRKGWWAAYSALSLVAVSTHLTAIFVLVAQAIWAVVTHREQLKPLIIANVVAAVTFMPWLPRLRRDDVGGLLDLYGSFNLSPSELGDELAHLLVGYPFVGLGEIPGSVVTAAFLTVFCALVAAAAWRGWRRGGRPGALDVLLVLLPLAVIGGLIANAILSGRDVVLTRNMISAMPYVAVLIGVLVTRLPRRMAVAEGAVLLCSVAIGAVLALGDAGQRPRFRDTATHLRRELRPGDVVLERLLFQTYGEFGQPLTRHLKVYLDVRVPYFQGDGDDADDAAVRAAKSAGGRVFLVQPSRFETVGVPDAIGPGGRFRLTDRYLLPGIHPIAVATYSG